MKIIHIVICAVLLVIILWLCMLGIVLSNVLSNVLPSWAEKGQLGDSFGVLNALFSGLAFAGLIITIYLQKKELESQRIELANQRFENTFFQLINLHHQIVIDMDVPSPDGPQKGRDVFKTLYERFISACSRKAYEFGKGHTALDLKESMDIYLHIFIAYESDLAHYFRNLYHITNIFISVTYPFQKNIDTPILPERNCRLMSY